MSNYFEDYLYSRVDLLREERKFVDAALLEMEIFSSGGGREELRKLAASQKRLNK
jgi:hypothetical protein